MTSEFEASRVEESEFRGSGAALTEVDYERAARNLGCEVAAVKAVAQVESAGAGFLSDGRPKILFERHIFHKRTGGRFSATHPHISSPRRGGYLGGTREFDRLGIALALDREAALESASWGKFQIMGFNATACGHADVEAFVRAMVSGEPAQLEAFVAFIHSRKLDDDLVRRDWAAFARGYNGLAFAENAYDRKMAEAYARFAGIEARRRPILRQGDHGEHVVDLQRLLRILADGTFGPVTEASVRDFQRAAGLTCDGVVGAMTWKALSA